MSYDDDDDDNHFYAARPKSYQIRWIGLKWREITAIMPFKVIQGHLFWYQSKAHIRLRVPILVINTKLPPILHRFRYIAFDRSKIAIFG